MSGDNLLIREGRAADWTAVAALEEDAADGWSARQLAAEQEREGAWLFIALDPSGGEVVGYIFGGRVLDEAEIFRLLVRPRRRRAGIATALWRRAAGELAAGGIRRCLLEVRAGNQAALAFYAAAGFGPVGRRRAYYREPREDAVIMVGAIGNAYVKQEAGA